MGGREEVWVEGRQEGGRKYLDFIIGRAVGLPAIPTTLATTYPTTYPPPTNHIPTTP